MSRTFRVFVSSTFADFVEERRRLQEQVFPELVEFASSRGAVYEPIDLRWGIGEWAQRQHSTMDICLSELARAQTTSPDLNFIVLLGQRYGWEPIPARISNRTWHALMTQAADDERQLLEACFVEDANQLPESIWLLKPQETWPSHEVGSGADAEPGLRGVLRALAIRAHLPDELRDAFFRSATHHEIAAGALDPANAGAHVTTHIRTIEDVDALTTLDVNTGRLRSDFLDLDEDGRPVRAAAERLDALIGRMRQRTNSREPREYRVRWSVPEDRESYLADFAGQVLADQKALLTAALTQGAFSVNPEDQEVVFARQRTRVMMGRDAEMRTLRRYVAGGGPQAQPLMVVGRGGSGKSSLIASAFLETRERMAEAIVLVRFVGALPGTESLRLLVTDVANAVSTQCGVADAPVGEGASGVAETFRSVLRHASADRPIVLFIDSVDLLSSEERAHELAWLPATLPPYVRVVVSARADSIAYENFRAVPGAQSIDLGPIRLQDAEQILRQLLSGYRRTLGDRQAAAVLSAFQRNGMPLWLVIAAGMCSRVRSSDPAPQLPGTIPGIVNRLITDLQYEGGHGSTFTRRALAYLATSRFGLTEKELGRALGNDGAVRNDFDLEVERTGQLWDREELPPIIWARLRFDLAPYLSEQTVDGALTTRLFHREFETVVTERFLGPVGDSDLLAHAGLAYAFAPPFERDNWARVRATAYQDARVLRSLKEQQWHLLRCQVNEVGSSERGLPESSALIRRHFVQDPLARSWPGYEAVLGRAAAGIAPPPFSEWTRDAETAAGLGFLVGDSSPAWPSDVTWSLVRAVADGHSDVETAVSAWHQAAATPQAQTNLGWYRIDLQDYAGAYAHWLAAAEGGHADAMINLGVLARQNGDLTDFERWWDRAAATDTLAMALVAAHAAACGDVDLQQRMFDRAAALGDPDGMLTVAMRALRGGESQVARTLLERAAGAGNAEAMLKLGLMQEEAGDVSAAEDTLVAAANLGSTSAMVSLGSLAYRVEDVDRAAKWWTRAADAGDTRAMVNLGLLWSNRGDTGSSTAWYRRAADAGASAGMVKCASGARALHDDLTASSWLERAVALGDVDAMVELGSFKLEGGDAEAAYSLWKRAEQLGSIDALVGLGHLSRAAGDVAAATQLWIRAAQAGNATAMVRLASVALREGDEDTAVAMWERAGRLRNANALMNLALRAWRRGEPEEAVVWEERLGAVGRADLATYNTQRAERFLAEGNEALAVPLLNRAATLGDVRAMTHLAEIAQRSLDRDGESYWRVAAASTNDRGGMTALGKFYAEAGQWVEAAQWWELAADAGSTAAMTNLATVARGLGDDAAAHSWLVLASDTGTGEADRARTTWRA